MAGLSEKIGGRKGAAILTLLTARSVEDAARAANVPPRTLYRWVHDPDFDTALRRMKRLTFGQSLSRFQQASGAAAGNMLRIMADNTVHSADNSLACHSSRIFERQQEWNTEMN